MRAKLVIGRDNIRCAPLSIDIRPPVCFALHLVRELEKISTCTLIYDIFARVCSYHVVVADTTERVCVLALRRDGRQSRILVVRYLQATKYSVCTAQIPPLTTLRNISCRFTLLFHF